MHRLVSDFELRISNLRELRFKSETRNRSTLRRGLSRVNKSVSGLEKSVLHLFEHLAYGGVKWVDFGFRISDCGFFRSESCEGFKFAIPNPKCRLDLWILDAQLHHAH